MRRILPLAFAFCIITGTLSATAEGGEKAAPSPRDKVTYEEVVGDHPQLKRMVDEDAFNKLEGEEQWDLINMVDKYAFFISEAEYYAGDRGSQTTAVIYYHRARSLKKEIKKRFGHVLKKK